MLIDTGSTNSFIHSKIAAKYFKKDLKDDPISIHTTHGTTQVKQSTIVPAAKIFNQPGNLKFHVFNFHTYFDGLLGFDNLQKAKASINTARKVLETPYGQIPFHTLQTNQKLVNFSFSVPKYSEMVVQIPLAEKNASGNHVIPHVQLGENVEIVAGIGNVVEGLVTCSLTNNSPVDVKITLKKPIPSIPLENFQIEQDNGDLNNIEKVDFDMSILRTDHLNSEEYFVLEKIVRDYRDIFYLDGDTLSFAHSIKHVIRTTDETPVFTKSYRYPYIHKEEVQNQIQKMLDQGIIRPSYSPWNSPIWVVPKKLDASGKRKWRIVVDYRKLNAKTVGDRYPLPNITDLLDKLGRCAYFSTLDLAQGFHQLEVSPESIPKTAFSTENGHYEYVRMPFGLVNAPSTFQRAMDHILRGLQNKICLVYMDDIIIFSTSLQDHENHLKAVFDELRQFDFKLQLDKSEFLRKEVEYLGHVVTVHGVRPNPKKIEAIRKYPLPDSVTKIKGFLGLLGYYRRFIKDFASLTKPFTKRLKKDAPLNLEDPEYLQCFETCKNILSNDPILQYPRFDERFILTTDASSVAIGSILSQGKIGSDLPIAYASRTLNESEQRYSVIERELLAVVWSVKHYRPYLFGRKFTIVTDHKPLEWLFSLKDPNSKLVHWRLKLEEYDYDIVYKKGRNNVNADALSRIEINHIEGADGDSLVAEPPSDDEPDIDVDINGTDDVTAHSSAEEPIKGIPISEKPVNFGKNQLIFALSDSTVLERTVYNLFHNTKKRHVVNLPKDCSEVGIANFLRDILEPTVTYYAYFKNDELYPVLTRVFRQYFADNKINVIKCTQFLIDVESDEEIQETIANYHESKTNHRGVNETEAHLLRRYYWPNMRAAIQTYINNCELCNLTKYERNPIKMQLNETPTPTKPFEIIHIDLLSIEKVTFLTIIDSFSKYGQAYVMQTKQTIEVADKLLTYMSHHGIPKFIVMDKGSEFRSHTIEELCKLHKIDFHIISSNHPESNGMAERYHSTLIEHCKLFRQRDEFKKEPITSILKYALIAYNHSVHSTTRLTPFEIIWGHLENENLLLTEKIKVTQNYVQEHKNKCDELYKTLTDRIKRVKKATLNRVNRTREKRTPKIPEKSYFRNDRGRQKTKPVYVRAKISNVNPKLKTAVMANPARKAGEKIHINQLKRPRKYANKPSPSVSGLEASGSITRQQKP